MYDLGPLVVEILTDGFGGQSRSMNGWLHVSLVCEDWMKRRDKYLIRKEVGEGAGMFEVG